MHAERRCMTFDSARAEQWLEHHGCMQLDARSCPGWLTILVDTCDFQSIMDARYNGHHRSMLATAELDYRAISNLPGVYCHFYLQATLRNAGVHSAVAVCALRGQTLHKPLQFLSSSRMGCKRSK